MVFDYLRHEHKNFIEIACSKRSDSGERCEVKKAMKSRGGLGREVPHFFAVLFYFAQLPATWTPGTGYVEKEIAELHYIQSLALTTTVELFDLLQFNFQSFINCM